ncbi:MAG: hypothetical protein Q4F31_04920 [Eubacteriales bacterium]|nr:hypothetical protein [Eubacteriales bacterium]
MMSDNKKRKLNEALFFVLVFLFMFVFFSVIHPVTLLDADDWTYISFSRAILPSTKFFNPARIFPEVFMSFCGSIAAFVITPVTGQYMKAVTAVMAAAYSLFIAAYALEMVLFLRSRFRIPAIAEYFLSLIFLVFHFMFFRTSPSGNTYLFWSKDATCYFYYNIPILMNCILVMRFMRKNIPDFSSEGEYLRKSLFILLVYFSVFSNLYASIIIAGYLASVLVLRLVKCIREKIPAVRFLKDNAVELLIELLWIVSAVFELCGDRAEAAVIEDSAVGNIGLMLPEALSAFFGSLRSANKILLLFLFAAVFLAVLCLILRRNKKEDDSCRYVSMILECAVSFIVVSVLLILLAAASSARYAGISTNLLAVLFFVFLAAVSSLACAAEHFSSISVFLPFIFCLLVSLTNTSYVTFLDSNDILVDGDRCIEIGEDLIAQFQAAEKEGLTEFDLHVLDTKGGEDSDNWPHTYYMKDRISLTLNKHGLVSEYIECTVCPDESFNEKHGIHCWD